MRRYLLLAFAIAAGLLGVAVHFVSPIAAIALTTAGYFAGFLCVKRFNTPLVRAGMILVGALLAWTIAAASGSWLLGASVLPFAILGPPRDLTVRLVGFRFSLVVFASVLSALALVFASGAPSWWWLAAAPVVGWSIFFTAKMGMGTSTLLAAGPGKWNVQIGDLVPEIVLPARLGKPEFRLSAKRGRYVFLQFLRGDWCPVCHIIMRVLSQEAPRLAQRNVEVVLISPSHGPEAEEFARALGLECWVLIDPEHTAARLFGAFDPTGNTAFESEVSSLPLPASFVVDPEGRLKFATRADDVGALLDPHEILRSIP